MQWSTKNSACCMNITILTFILKSHACVIIIWHCGVTVTPCVSLPHLDGSLSYTVVTQVAAHLARLPLWRGRRHVCILPAVSSHYKHHLDRRDGRKVHSDFRAFATCRQNVFGSVHAIISGAPNLAIAISLGTCISPWMATSDIRRRRPHTWRHDRTTLCTLLRYTPWYIRPVLIGSYS